MDELRHFLHETFRTLDAGIIDRSAAACKIGRRLCEELGCDRAGVVSLDGAQVVRLGGYDAVVGRPLEPDVVLSNESGKARHVAALKMGVYPPIGEDSPAWPEALRHLYLTPLGLQSLTVAAIGTKPNVTGFVCAASLTERQWSRPEMAKLRFVANAIALRRARFNRESVSKAFVGQDGSA